MRAAIVLLFKGIVSGRGWGEIDIGATTAIFDCSEQVDGLGPGEILLFGNELGLKYRPCQVLAW